MESTRIFILLIVSFGLIFSTSNLNSQNKISSKNEIDSVTYSYPEQPTIYKIKCTGTCPGGERCSLIIGEDNFYAECNCEGCALTIESNKGIIEPSEESRLISELSKLELFSEYLEEFVKSKFNTDKFSILGLEYATIQNNYYVHYEIITNKEEIETVIYLSTASTDTAYPPKRVQIDCSETENYSGKKCYEKYIFPLKTVECVSETDDCKMNIKEL